MATVEDLERRVEALEKAQNTNTETLEWMAGTLGRMKATADLHTGRFNELDNRVDRVEQKLSGVEQRLTSRIERVEQEVKKLGAGLICCELAQFEPNPLAEQTSNAYPVEAGSEAGGTAPRP